MKGQALTKDCRIEFVTKCIELLKDKEKWNYWSEKGRENAEKFSWQNCALNWKKLFEE